MPDVTRMTQLSQMGLPNRLDGRRLAVARTIWVVTVLGLTGSATGGFVRGFRDPELLALPVLTDLFAPLGLSLRLMMVLALIAPLMVVIVICWVVFWHRSRDPVALLFTLALLSLYTFTSRSLLAYEGDPLLSHSLSVVFMIVTVAFAAVLGLFPDGRFVPRAAQGLVPAALAVVIVFPDGGQLLMEMVDAPWSPSGRSQLYLVVWLAVFGFGFVAQVHRYRHVSGPTERQQAKWVMAPFGFLVVIFSAILTVPALVPGIPQAWVGWTLFAMIPVASLLPVMVANAVLRYRLYEIDRVISRTVSYTLVVGVLGLVYAVAVLGLGAAISTVTGQASSDLAVAGSVLAVVMLVRPVRSRVQGAVDRHFGRTGYEARLTVAAFGQQMRDEVDVGAVLAELVTAAVTVVQPRSVSVWMPPGDVDEDAREGSAGASTSKVE